MRRFQIVEPDVNWKPIDIIMTEEEIMIIYFPWWSSEMYKLGRQDKINYETCLEDWVVINWAVEL